MLKLTQILFLAAFFSCSSSSILNAATRCATPEPSAPTQLLFESIENTYRANVGLSRFTEQENIPIAFHIVRTSSTGWNVADAVIQEQLDALNAAYTNMDVSFFIQSVQRHVRPEWATVQINTAEEVNMKSALAVEPLRILNVYICESLAGPLGYAWFPSNWPQDSTRHGCVILRTSLPGNGDSFGLGQTLTHEVGHYLGVFHTFQGGCSVENDSCADTPAHFANYGRPPASTDTCASPGTDPVNNFMNYVDDVWMDNFTADQGLRASAITSSQRPDLLRNYI